MTIQPEAKAYLTELLTESEGLVVELTSGGCVGYQVSLKKTPLKDCRGWSIDAHGLVFVEDTQTQQILQDAELLFKDDGFNKGLHILPPADYDACGCGSSFAPRG